MIMGLTSIRADDTRMGGVTFLSENGKDKNWSVDPAKSDLKITLPGMGEDEDGNVDDLEININAKAGDDIEELATYINGQSDMINASVSEDGKLQVFVAHPNVQGEISISGGLASELGLSDEPIRTSVQDIDMTTVQGSQNAISVLDSALKYVDSQRADLGAKQNRLSHSINNLANIQENVDASNSRIKDTDFAKETTQMTKAQILQQAGTSILAQAKQLPNSAMSLLQ